MDNVFNKMIKRIALPPSPSPSFIFMSDGDNDANLHRYNALGNLHVHSY